MHGARLFKQRRGCWIDPQIQVLHPVGSRTFRKLNPLDVNFRPNSYIHRLTGDTGYEEPGEFGGSDRTYVVADSEEQFTFNPSEGISFFNGISSQAFINQANTIGGASTVKFRVDMNPAKTFETPFVAGDSVFVVFETSFFALTQGIPSGRAIG